MSDRSCSAPFAIQGEKMFAILVLVVGIIVAVVLTVMFSKNNEKWGYAFWVTAFGAVILALAVLNHTYTNMDRVYLMTKASVLQDVPVTINYWTMTPTPQGCDVKLKLEDDNLLVDRTNAKVTPKIVEMLCVNKPAN